ncbi:hypothetical protein C3747_15g243 [Trypanosoma cruzi]|uniref:Uncharacterized protein n=2 Tax=Trypanosoma cruzi TaxID=5693 RepID=Q4D8G1_TRYCC|nr:hypothetical protein Tc00.1047053508567.30 [Trypanosoma cruzi]EAN88807.1 hypothetical protein Tc00.1047053508567.30 [Trypanosoma cruzi]PWV18082.1 hypothetical protein C3747_15g243 [Trypanosoma cruzi]RNC56837.1 hypothetical protein TcCL_ESM05609 [Trypanosoma cruzi]|eukprot:XP_810658.1 hypothetical protein [Trypanosoma cruzi strain CL Brener]
MDFFTVLNQRQLDQNSELRRIYRVSACYATAALGALLLASVAVPMDYSAGVIKRGFQHTFSLMLFLIFTIVAYLMMVRALNVLSTNRFILSPAYASSCSAPFAFSIALPYQAFTRKKRVVLTYAPLFLTLMCLYVGLFVKSYILYICFLFLHIVVFCILWIILSRLISPLL